MAPKVRTPLNQLLKCSFSDICESYQCGLSKKYMYDANVELLQQCKKDIRNHLKRLNVSVLDVKTEWELILIALRCGLFDHSLRAVREKIKCPAHRYRLGLSWVPSRKCQHPLHSPSTKQKPYRGIGTAKSMEIHEI